MLAVQLGCGVALLLLTIYRAPSTGTISIYAVVCVSGLARSFSNRPVPARKSFP
jgi:hypothetical protein